MMKQTFTLFFLLVALLLPESSEAQTVYSVVSEGLTLNFIVNGTEATITGTPDKTPSTTQGSSYVLNNGGVLKIPATVSVGANTYTVTRIGGYAFSACGITSLTLPPTLKVVEEGAFAMNTTDIAYDDLIIPASVEKIEQQAFRNHRIKHLSFEEGSKLSYLGGSAFGTYRPASLSWSDTFTGQSSEYNIEYYDFSNTQLTSSVLKADPYRQQFYVSLFLQGRILMYLPASFDVYPCGGLNEPSMSGGMIDQTADETNIVRANGYCDHLLISDDMSFRVPKAFTAKKATYNRTFSNTTGKAVSTLYLPYPTDLPAGMQAYTLTQKGLDINGDKAFCFSGVPLGTRLEANTPYLVRITDGQSHTLPEMQNVFVPVTPDIQSSAVEATADGDWKFYGTTEFIHNTVASTKKAYYLNGNKWWAVQNGVTNDYIAPYRCFIASPTGAVPAKSFLMVLDDELNSTTAGIRQLEHSTEADIQSGRYPFYSIDGRQLGTNYNALKSGQIYIVNGKKIYKF